MENRLVEVTCYVYVTKTGRRFAGFDQQWALEHLLEDEILVEATLTMPDPKYLQKVSVDEATLDAIYKDWVNGQGTPCFFNYINQRLFK
jgi:hypothetical protein